ncbi:hypothetical protein UPYG_G00042070 [Umbra pygmaea]|uniref:Uncharacterized protein n=1 Tax=Umbra pygmaea TaxID=75934 RepID=A0ABD0XRX4_UMBPY
MWIQVIALISHNEGQYLHAFKHAHSDSTDVLHVAMTASTGVNGTQDKTSTTGAGPLNGTTNTAYQLIHDGERYTSSPTQSTKITTAKQTKQTPPPPGRPCLQRPEGPHPHKALRPFKPKLIHLIRCITRRLDQDSSAPQLLLGVRDRVRGGVRSLEERLGLSLWPGKRAGDEGGEDEEDDDEVKSVDGRVSVEGVKAGRSSVDDKGDSSSDYSSLEGVDLRERAKNLEEVKMEDGEEKQEVATSNGRKQSDTSGDSAETDEEQKGVTSGEVELSDLTIL